MTWLNDESAGKRVISTLIVSGSGGVFALIHLWHLYSMDYSLVIGFVVDVVPFLIALGIVLGGIFLGRLEQTTRQMALFVGWYIGGVLALLGGSLAIQIHLSVHGQGLEHALSVHASLGGFGGLAGLLIGWYDHQRRKRLIQVINERERLDEFTSVVSHDLRNPLSVAELRLELAQQEAESEHLADVEQAHERMQELIDDFLMLARSGESIDEMEQVVLSDLASRCWKNTKTTDASLSVRTESTLLADSERLQQLLENLFRNAIQHGGPSVTVIIDDLEHGGGFYVEDDGPGIPEERRSKVFDSGYTTADDGTGLGLQIVKNIAEAHGWELNVTDGAEGGARIEVRGVQPAPRAL